MAGNRWCNVHREDDKVTRWIMNDWMKFGKWGVETIPMALCVARLVNWPDTLEMLGYPYAGWDSEYRQRFLNVIGDRKKAGLKSWTGAYMVTGGFSAGGESKEEIIARVLDGAALTCNTFVQTKPTHLAGAAKILTTPGIGAFLVAQVIADLKNTLWLKHADDWWNWCAPGPGSTMGLNFLHDRPRAKPIGNDQFMSEVEEIRELLHKHLDLMLCAQNTQNCLCELSKYIRAKHFGERLKNTYQAVTPPTKPDPAKLVAPRPL